jgi:SAM-dependent methyltransferase
MIGFVRSKRLTGLIPVLADAEALPLATGSVDVACAPFGFITNFADERLLARLLREVGRVVRPGGLVLLNGFDAGRLRRLYPDDTWHPYNRNGTAGPPVARVRVSPRPGQDALTLRFRLARQQIRFDLRGWAPHDVTAVAATSDLSVEAVVDSTSGVPYEDGSEEYVVIARKVGRQ